jgi:gamma-glutamyltranspeptidase
VRLANGSSAFINAREPAPAAANATMYAGLGPRASLDGGLAVGVPCELRGLEAAWRAYGTLPWSRLAAPAAALARSGFGAHPYLVYVLTGPANLERVKRNPALREAFLIPDGAGGWRAPVEGELCCRRPALADTLEAIGRHGPGWLYSAEVAGKLAAEVRAAGGVVTAEDIMGVAPVVTAPLTTQVRRRTRGGTRARRGRRRGLVQAPVASLHHACGGARLLPPTEPSPPPVPSSHTRTHPAGRP